MAFLMGNYNFKNINYIKNLINLMTIKEKENIITKNFDELWLNLWNNVNNRCYLFEKNKFLKLKKIYNLKKIVNESTTKWTTPEWGFPKGRKEKNETNKECGLRELFEETGYKKSYLAIFENVLPINEYIIGSNKKIYKHKYYFAYMKPNYINNYKIQELEVSKLKWFTIKEAQQNFRKYNSNKIKILKNIEIFLNKYKTII